VEEKQFAVYAIHPGGMALRISQPTTEDNAYAIKDYTSQRAKIEIVPLEVHEYPWVREDETVL
jgi:hypothetical protein